MATTQRSLFPTLPAELRNEIYSHLTSTSSQHPHPLTTGLQVPLPLKAYTTAHTTTTLVPTHTGSLSLLALRAYGFLESEEYHDYLLTHGITMYVGIEFHGRVNTFDPRIWEDKMRASLRKLVKKFPWVATARRWDVRVLWDPLTPGASAQRCKANNPGRVVDAIAGTFVAFVEQQGVGKMSVEVDIRWCVPSALAALDVAGVWKLGVGEFFAQTNGKEGGGDVSVVREAYVVGLGERTMEKVQDDVLRGERVAPGLVRTMERLKGQRGLLVIEHGKAFWRRDVDGGTLLMKTTSKGGMLMAGIPAEEASTLVVQALRDECRNAKLASR